MRLVRITSSSREWRIRRQWSAGVGLALFLTVSLISGDVWPGPAGASVKPLRLAPLCQRPAYTGINLAGGEFAADQLPGVYGKNYIFPGRETVAPYLAMGANTVRIPFLWERIQPTPMGPLDPAELARLDTSVRELGDVSLIILDLHNYGRYREQPLDRSPGSAGRLAHVWRKLADHYRGSPKVAFGLMNEPHDLAAGDWRPMLDRTVTAFRATGAKNLLLIPGVRWTGGQAWLDGGADSSARQLAGFRDPANHFLFEIHQYLDGNSSGTGSDCVSATIGRERLAGVTDWLRREKAGAFLGEFGGTRSATCLAALDGLLGYLDSNGDVWRGWTYWAGGDWWGDYPYSIAPGPSGERAQAAVIRHHMVRFKFGSPACREVERRAARAR